MRVLLDECLPRRLGSELSQHDVYTVAQVGWAGVSNGQLLQKAAAEFDCFVRVDRNLQFQQHLGLLPIAVLVMRARGNRIEDLLPLLPGVRRALAEISSNELMVVGDGQSVRAIGEVQLRWTKERVDDVENQFRSWATRPRVAQACR